ncbi:TPM domain-containing protein [Rothia nasimurium]|uniref:TPM domain-containing protein n=1 Tax=Rothia nasimurium TaxID=85336 RepID=UPI003B9FB625
MPRKPVLTAALLAALSLGLASPALAEEPFDLSPGVRVADTTGALGATDQLQDSIAELTASKQVNLFVVTVDEFEQPSSSADWASDFAQMNNMGSNDVLLVIATEARQAYFIAGSTGVLSASQQEEIYQNYIFPELSNSDYPAAAEAAITGISEALSSSSSGTGAAVAARAGEALVGGGVLLGVAALAGGGAYAVSRARRNSARPTSQPGRPRPTANGPHPTIDQLRTQAGHLLVQTDDAIAHSLQEVEFARLQYGDAEVAPFVRAIEQAKAHMQRSFQLQKQLDDEIPDTEADQRAWLTEIIGRTQDAQKALSEQVANFTNLRKLEDKAPAALATLRQQLASANQLFAPAQAALDRLGAAYAPTAFGAVAENVAEARNRLAFAQESAAEAEGHMAGNRSAAIMELRAAEEALGQAKGLLEAVHKAETDLGAMSASLDNALLIADRDVASARELAKAGSPASAQLSASAAGVAAVLGSIRAERAAGLIDPYVLNARLHEVRSDLDAALGTVRQSHEQVRSAQESLKHALISAQAQVSTANDYVWGRRGGVKSEARTRLREAERNLSEAQSLQVTDPVTALARANEAIRLAGDAQRIARSDVDSFNRRHSYRPGPTSGGNFNSAMLGGILLGTLLGGNNNSSSSGGSWGGGTFGGGFGGGGFGGGFGSGGGAGGNF